MTIRVKASHPLIGETSYVPDGVSVTNSFDKPIVITRVELFANGATYQDTQTSLKKQYPLTIEAGKTQVLPMWFKLNDAVQRTFKTPAELRVYYRNGSNQSVAYAFIVGGPLEMETP